MQKNIQTIDICIATYKRPDGLRKLLESIALNAVADRKIRIIIIDNDPEKSAQPGVDEFFKGCHLDYIYDFQPEKNIALTRNKALTYINADYIIFVDDDEWVESDWLSQLIQASQHYDADVVFGQVVPQYPDSTPDWVKSGRFYYGGDKTGSIKQHGATNNTLVRNPAKFKSQLFFDKDYGITGGSDTELFYRLYLQGAKLIWSNESIVYEIVPPERARISWLLKRALRSGQVYARIFHKNQSFDKIALHFLKRSVYLALACALFPLSLVMGRSRWVWVLQKIMANYGQLNVLFSNNFYQEYK